ncbi:MAG: arsenate reductase (glutaredoxin) [Pseudomonadales bacterium]|nr:arsenate reductase (glutaredoxin) [Pseudomonadales bacterium]
MADVTIYHNPKCSKSRQTLALLEEKNITPEIILYLESPPEAKQLIHIIALLGINARGLIRTGEAEYTELGLDDDNLAETLLIDAMVNTPKLMQRPIVIANGQARIGRPPEAVLEII